MEEFLARVTGQAMNYAIRTGITITATYALRQSSRLIRTAEDGTDKAELQRLQDRLESKIRIISPAIDMIELISARGNSSLETAVSLTKAIRLDVQALGQQIATAAATNDAQKSSTEVTRFERDSRLQQIVAAVKRLLGRIEDAVPLINLAITTSGANMSTALPPSISPSRLLQASTFVTAGDTQYAASGASCVQIGPTFTLSLYMLFAGHVRPVSEAEVRQTTWKEVVHKARVKLLRVPLGLLYDIPCPGGKLDHPVHVQYDMAAESRADEYAYQLVIIEDLDDDRVHTFDNDEGPARYEDVAMAGIREPLPIHEISKIFYADTGKILNIGDDETNSPVLLLKRDVHAVPPRRMLDRQVEEEEEREAEGVEALALDEVEAQIQRESRANSLAPEEDDAPKAKVNAWRIPSDLDPEWLAFEVFVEEPDSDTESDTKSPESSPREDPLPSLDPQLNSALSNLHLSTPTPSPSSKQSTSVSPARTPHHIHHQFPAIKTSLSLLETLLRLLSLQQFQQTSHLAIPDELLSFFLSEATSTTGAAHGNEQARRQLRSEARQRVGFDPYDESPIKRRGEAYQRYRGGGSQDGWGEEQGAWREDGLRQDYGTGWSSPLPPRSGGSWGGDEGYGTQRFTSEPPATPLVRAAKDEQARIGRAASDSPAAMKGKEERKGVGESPSVKARQRQLASEGRERRGSPLARVENSIE